MPHGGDQCLELALAVVEALLPQLEAEQAPERAAELRVRLCQSRHDSFALVLMVEHVVAIGLLVFLSRSVSPVMQFLREWSLLAYLPFCYKQIPYLITALKLPSADLMLAHWDATIWKVDPIYSLSLMLNRPLVEFLQIIYSLFIPSTIVLGVMMWRHLSKQEFRLCTFQVAATFLISYLGYVVVPARGPRFMDYVAHYRPLQGFWTFHYLQDLLNNMEGLQYDCFPSGHVAVVLVGDQRDDDGRHDDGNDLQQGNRGRRSDQAGRPHRVHPDVGHRRTTGAGQPGGRRVRRRTQPGRLPALADQLGDPGRGAGRRVGLARVMQLDHLGRFEIGRGQLGEPHRRAAVRR